MKNIRFIPALVLLSGFTLGFISCNSSKTAVSCPEIKSRKSEYRAQNNRKNHNNLISHKYRSKTRKSNLTAISRNQEIKPSSPFLKPEQISRISKIEYSKGLIVSSEKSFHPIIKTTSIPAIHNSNLSNYKSDSVYIERNEPCDTIFLKSGAIITGKVEEIGNTKVWYRKCNKTKGPKIVLFRSNISKIHYGNGITENLSSDEAITSEQKISNDNGDLMLKAEGLGIIGLYSSIFGLFVATIPLGIIAIIFGSVSLSKINKNPDKYSGKGTAVASIIIGIIDVFVMIILLLL